MWPEASKPGTKLASGGRRQGPGGSIPDCCEAEKHHGGILSGNPVQVVEVDVGNGSHVDVVGRKFGEVDVGGGVDEDAAEADGDVDVGALTLNEPGDEQEDEGEYRQNRSPRNP